MSNQNDSYQTIAEISEGFYKEKGSKFLGFAIPCDNKEDAKLHIDAYRKEHHNACHVCFAWRFGKNEPFEDRFSDDGEPNNSAGKPIFGQIIAADVTNVLIAVVRYYGGTNLGVGGLINAYRTSAKEAMEEAKCITEYILVHFKIKHSFESTGDIMSILNKYGGNIEKQDFENNQPTVEFNIKQGDASMIEEKLNQIQNIKIEVLN